VCGSSDFLDIKEYTIKLRKAIYPKLSKNPTGDSKVFDLFFWEVKNQLTLPIFSSIVYILCYNINNCCINIGRGILILFIARSRYVIENELNYN
jgi:hypothetical protein